MGYRVVSFRARLDKEAATYVTNYLIVGLTTLFALPFLHGADYISLMFLTYALGNLVFGVMHQFLKPFVKVTEATWVSSEALVITSNVLLLAAILAPIVNITSVSLGLVILCMIGGTIYSEKMATVLGGGISVSTSIALLGTAYYLAYWLPQPYWYLPLIASVSVILNVIYILISVYSKPSKWKNFRLHILAIGHYITLFVYFVITGVNLV